MPSQTISHVICTAALVALIFVSQFFYVQVVNNLQAEMTRRELKEIADYVSDTLANLYILVNSSNLDVALEKSLSLPSEIRDSRYTVEIVSDASGSAQSVSTQLEGQSSVYAGSWLLPGLMVHPNKTYEIQSGGQSALAGCCRVNPYVYVWIEKE